EVGQISKIVLRGLAGNDVLNVGLGVGVPADIDAGAGNDQIHSRNNQNDTVDGGADVDTAQSDSGDIVTNVENAANGTISGTVFNDQNSSGVRNIGEGILSGWTIYLDANNNSVFDEGEVYSVSDETGAYSFAGLVAG